MPADPPQLVLAGAGVADGRGAPVGAGTAAAAVLAGAAATAACLLYARPVDALIGAALSVVLVVLGAIDLGQRLIPNRIVLPAAAAILVARVLSGTPRPSMFVFGAIVASGILLLPHLVSPAWMGMGDVKLALLLGAGLGWGGVGAVIVAFLAVFPFALWALARSGLRTRSTQLPFGPFLAFGGLAILLLPRALGLA